MHFPSFPLILLFFSKYHCIVRNYIFHILPFYFSPVNINVLYKLIIYQTAVYVKMSTCSDIGLIGGDTVKERYNIAYHNFLC